MDLYDQLLAATIQRLEILRESRVKYIPLDPDTVHSIGTFPVAARMPTKAASPQSISTPVPSPAQPVAVESSKSQALDALAAQAKACVLCPHLAISRKSVVFGVGDINAPLMFVGEAPGADEDIQGEPFVGRAGQLLTKMIQAMGLDRNKVYIANVLKCRPDMPANSPGNRKPTPAEMNTCVPYLERQIDLIKPRVIVALGGTALEGLTRQESKILSQRGKWMEYRNIPLMPTLHPAYLLRNENTATKRLAWEDMLQVMDKLAMPISEKQKAFFTRA
jgi:uracil-DNA glycosylase family 4